MELILLIVGFMASVVGATCGIGGGVIIKPILDTIGFADASTISFLSGLTVLCMSAYNIIKAVISKEKLNLETGLPLAFGAAIGGVLGKQLFNIIKQNSANPSFVGFVQAASLGIATFLTLIYTINSDKIKKKQIKSKPACVVIGFVLGMMSSFMGIGGGPFNLAVLSYFFSLPTKQATQGSLFIILLSQIFALMTTFITNTVPDFKISWVIIMAISGITGGMLGRILNKKLDNKSVNNLFIAFLVLIILISIYNSYRFFI